jgi:hypothetical protein
MDEADRSEQAAQDMSRTQRTAPAAQAEAITAMIQATLTPIVAPLVAELAASRQTIERQTGQLIGQAETIGRQGAELERAASTIMALGEQNDALRAAQAKQDASPGPVALEPTTDAPVQHQINPGALVPWLFTALALFGGGRAVAADMSPEALYAGAVVVAVAVVGYVVWKRRRPRNDAGTGGGS